LGTSRMRGRRDDGPPVYTYEMVPGVPPVSAIRLGQESSPGGLPPGAHSHSHDFLVLTFHLERDGGSLRLGDRKWQIEAGDVYLIAPGEIVDPSGLEVAEGWPSSSHPRSSGPGPPAPISRGALTLCSSPSCGARQEALNV
jgi:AraC family transcriptional regulator, transcriptional activator of pobA